MRSVLRQSSGELAPVIFLPAAGSRIGRVKSSSREELSVMTPSRYVELRELFPPQYDNVEFEHAIPASVSRDIIFQSSSLAKILYP